MPFDMRVVCPGMPTNDFPIISPGYPITKISAAYTVKNTDTVILCTASSVYTVTLPQGAAYADKVFDVVKDAGANAITVAGASGQINGAANDTLAASAYHCGRYISDGTNYTKIGGY